MIHSYKKESDEKKCYKFPKFLSGLDAGAFRWYSMPNTVMCRCCSEKMNSGVITRKLIEVMLRTTGKYQTFRCFWAC